MNEKIIDIIIPTYKPDQKFTRLIQKLEEQTYPIRSVHIINTDVGGFPEEIRNSKLNIEVTHILPKEFDHGGTRNKGAQMSDADIFVCMTQDAVPVDSFLIEELVKPFSENKVAVSYGRQLPVPGCDIVERYTRGFNYPPVSRVKAKKDIPELGIKTFFASNVCAAYDKSIFEQIGGFVNHTIFNEDMIYAGTVIKAGYKVAYVAEAKVIHSHNYGYVEQFRRNFDLAVSQKDHPEIFATIKSETEGIKLVKQTMKYLLDIKRPCLVLGLIVKSGYKYLGYKCGMNYSKLPHELVLRFTMHPRYWDF